MKTENNNPWFKNRGYLHITSKINIYNPKNRYLLSLIKNDSYVAKHAFFPLIHSVIRERKFKLPPNGVLKKLDRYGKEMRAHSYKEGDKYKKTAKDRPLHYATHIDALIFGYYAELLSEKYEKRLKEINNAYPGFEDCIIAYRKIPIDRSVNDKGKSTIHFTKEVFDEIRKRSSDECYVKTFDIKSFFSRLDHDKLKEAWYNLFDDIFSDDRLNDAHFNVYKAATNFRYILLDDLRKESSKDNKKAGFDERKLAEIRKYKGKEAFFESVKDFRDAIAQKKITVYKKPFVNRENGKAIGIPQGLPISAVLANIYLLEFDLKVYEELVNSESKCFYRRYSDDILIICTQAQNDYVEDKIDKNIREVKLEINKDKTETFRIYKSLIHDNRIVSSYIPAVNNFKSEKKPLTYLGFEFHGDHTLLKSANLAKFYRRMIKAVKRKAALAVLIAEKTGTDPIIFENQLKRHYSNPRLSINPKEFKRKKLVFNKEKNFFEYQLQKENSKDGKRNIKKPSNYLSFVKRCSKIMDEPKIEGQLRKHQLILKAAIEKQIEKQKAKRDRYS